MRPRVIGALLWNELRQLLRDRRTVSFLLLLPLLLDPLATWIGARVMARLSRPAPVTAIALWGRVPPIVESALRAAIGANVVERADGVDPDAANQRVRRTDVALVVVAKGDGAGAVERDGAASIALYYDPLRRDSVAAERGARAALLAAADGIVAARLLRHHLPAALARPLIVIDGEVTAAARLAADLRGRALALLLLFVVLGTSAAAAVDALAGERERRTLPILLGAGARPLEIVAGKCLALLAIATAGALANAGALALSSAGVGLAKWSAPAAPLVALTLAMTALVVALLLTASAFARSAREAQVWSEWLQVPLIGACLMGCLPGMQPTSVTAMIPLFGTVLALRALFADGAASLLTTLNALASVAVAALALWLTARRLGRPAG